MIDETNNSEELDHYLSDPLNVRIYQNLERLAFIKPLGFFKFFYELIDLLEAGKSQSVIDRINELNITDGIKTFILYYLLDKYRNIFPGAPVSMQTPPSGSLLLLEKELQRLESLGPDDPKYMFFYVDSESPDIRARAIVSLSKISNEAVEKMLRKMWDEAEEKREIERLAEMRGREAERERIEQTILQEIRNITTQAAGTVKRNPEFTTNRQVLALCYMLKHLQVKDVPKTVQGQFIEFLTGRNSKDIYDKVRNFDTAIFNWGGEDAKYVREWFAKLGLTEIVKEIDQVIGKESKKF